MLNGPLQWLRTKFDAGNESSESRERRQERTEPAALYECPDCGTVYIHNDPRPCPDCGTDLKNVPNERDLGLKTDEV